MPEADTTELSVLFLVSVAAEELIRDNDMGHPPFLFQSLLISQATQGFM
jgi:hypothetical protein